MIEEELSYEEARELKEYLEELFDHPGWKWFQTFIEQRVRIRTRDLYQYCPDSTEMMVKFARLKGGLDELDLLFPAVHQVYSDLSSNLEKMLEEDSQLDEGAE